MTSAARRRILCIRPRLRERADACATAVSDAWVQALALHADIVSIDADFDFAEACERHKPDLVVIDALDATRPWPLTITRGRSHPDVPRLLFLSCAPHDPRRALTMRMADQIGIDAVFVPGMAHLQHMPELQQRACFTAPPVIDEAVWRDHGEPRTVPVLIFGDDLAPGLAAWRAQLLDEIVHAIPSLNYPASDGPFALSADERARLIGESHYCAVDTTRLDAVSHAHLAVPACGAILVAPQSEALASCGFVNMQNCILGSGNDLFEKMRLVARSPAAYRQIREAGAVLVARRFSGQDWRPMLDWLACREALKPGQIVQQVGPYGPFRGVTPTASTPSLLAAAPQAKSAMTAALDLARTAILSGRDRPVAQATLAEVAQWDETVAEPTFLLAMLALLDGDPVTAALAIGRRAQVLGAVDVSLGTLDPTETAWILLIARLIGSGDLESAMREQAGPVRHLALRRMDWLLAGGAGPHAGLMAREPDDLPSVHWLGDQDFSAWSHLVQRVLLANAGAAGSLAWPAAPLTAAA